MGISSSFNIGVSGLNALGKGLGIISDNIANAETNGFKTSRAEFQDLLSVSLKGEGRGNGADQMGTGVKLGSIKNDNETGRYCQNRKCDGYGH